MLKLAIFLLLTVWITLAAAGCSFNFGGSDIDLSGVGTIDGTWKQNPTPVPLKLNFCENIDEDHKWNMYGTGSGGDLISFGSATLSPLPTATVTGGVNTLTYSNSEADCYYRGYIQRTVIFSLKCGSQQSNFEAIPDESLACTWNVALEVNCDGSSGSKGGLSGGAIFLIIFFSLLAGYFIIGFIVCKFVLKKPTIVESIPNVTFWASLPGLFIAGIKYFIGCFTKKKASGGDYSESYGATEDV